jgi:hypothetical protein
MTFTLTIMVAGTTPENEMFHEIVLHFTLKTMVCRRPASADFCQSFIAS